jgi:hypothetical protein
MKITSDSTNLTTAILILTVQMFIQWTLLLISLILTTNILVVRSKIKKTTTCWIRLAQLKTPDYSRHIVNTVTVQIMTLFIQIQNNTQFHSNCFIVINTFQILIFIVCAHSLALIKLTHNLKNFHETVICDSNNRGECELGDFFIFERTLCLMNLFLLSPSDHKMTTDVKITSSNCRSTQIFF